MGLLYEQQRDDPYMEQPCSWLHIMCAVVTVLELIDYIRSFSVCVCVCVCVCGGGDNDFNYEEFSPYS